MSKKKHADRCQQYPSVNPKMYSQEKVGQKQTIGNLAGNPKSCISHCTTSKIG
jgi:hypothetical protein